MQLDHQHELEDTYAIKSIVDNIQLLILTLLAHSKLTIDGSLAYYDEFTSNDDFAFVKFNFFRSR